MLTVDVKDLLKLIFKIFMFIVLLGGTLWLVVWFNHGGDRQIQTWVSEVIRWIVAFFEAHRQEVYVIAGTGLVVGLVVLFITDDRG